LRREQLESTKRISLDVGCGSNPKGTVNVDFFREGYNPQTGDQKMGDYMKTQNIENFVIGDALSLPFRDESFSVVFSTHVIEHVKDPAGMLLEMDRVCKEKIIVRCPHRKGSNARKPFHINYLDERWFQHAASSMGLNMQYSIAYEYPILKGMTKIVPRKIRLKLKRMVR
jgi:ubiquinone/menaquinone biosynthesis C-methylase UbiE